MGSNRESVLLALKLLAAKAAKLAHDYERGNLWEGQLTEGLHELSESLSSAHKSVRHGE